LLVAGPVDLMFCDDLSITSFFSIGNAPVSLC
jgi:hypothetical protein